MNWKSSVGTCSKNALCSLCGNGHRTGVGCWLVYQFLQPPTQTVPGKAVPRRARMSISAEAGPGFSGQLGPIPAVEAVVPGVHGGDPRATRRALTSDGAARVGRRWGPPGAIREGRAGRSGAGLETPGLVAGFAHDAKVG